MLDIQSCVGLFSLILLIDWSYFLGIDYECSLLRGDASLELTGLLVVVAAAAAAAAYTIYFTSYFLKCYPSIQIPFTLS